MQFQGCFVLLEHANVGKLSALRHARVLLEVSFMLLPTTPWHGL